tara:strand:- start:16806 stop:17219 length:414 start_codon:yes stop_codon:yes gene_type:complete
MSLTSLAAFAAKTNNNSSRSPLHTLSIEDARAKVLVSDGNRKTVADGTQALTLTLGKHLLSLDVISAGATRIVTPAAKVEEFKALLIAEVAAGSFDVAIVAAQAKADPANKPVKAPVETAGDKVPVAPEGVDLDELG